MMAENIKKTGVRALASHTGNDGIWMVILSILVVLAQVADAMSNDVLQWFCSLSLLFLFLISTKRQEMPIMLFVVFNTKSLSLFGISCALLMAVVSVFKEMLFRKRKIKREELFFFIVFCFLGMILVVEDRISDFVLLIKYWFTIICVTNSFNGNNDARWYERCIKYMFLGFSTTILASMLFNRALLKETRYMLSSETGANMTAIFCGWILSYSAVLLLDRKVKKSIKAYAFIGFVLSLVAGVLTASRTFLLIVAVCCVVILYSSISKTQFFLRNSLIILLVCVVALVFIVFNDAINQEFMYLIRRVTKPRGNDISGGRLDIWNSYFIAIFASWKNLFLGFKPSDYGIMEMAHNAIIEQLVQYGALGNVFIVIFSFNALKIIKKNLVSTKNESYLMAEQNLNLLPGLAIIVSGMVSHSFMSLPKTIFIYFSLYLYLSHKKRKTCKILEEMS